MRQVLGGLPGWLIDAASVALIALGVYLALAPASGIPSWMSAP